MSAALAIRQHLTSGNMRVAALAAGLACAFAAFGPGWFSGWWLLARTATRLGAIGRRPPLPAEEARLEAGLL